MKAWIKSGLIVGVLQILFTLPAFTVFFLPIEIGAVISYVACFIFLFLYPLPGILEVHWTAEPRPQNEILKSGALSGFLASTIDGIVTFFLIMLVSVFGGMEKYLYETIPTEMEALSQVGFGSMFFIMLVLLQTCIALIFHILTGVILSPVGGLIYANIKNKKAKAE
jgi:magnesium-transporting ATPase (P-type)